MFALVDVNNFYASCETVFRPDLQGKPVVVVSNNDGCIISRSAEAKALGIKMAAPYFKIKDELRRQGVTVFSSNYALYADLSHRVMQTLLAFVPNVEIYSIDEAFIDLSGCRSLESFGHQIRETVQKHTGLTVGVGIGPTKPSPNWRTWPLKPGVKPMAWWIFQRQSASASCWRCSRHMKSGESGVARVKNSN
ncbi:hypothetical protein WP4W18E05_20240 [Klebsiella sp. WP4-W18-ESBL-05]|nr:hypothetical protein WP4W18E05_20240 [Klebsiella sp. WP4-W18-ESBL-05]